MQTNATVAKEPILTNLASELQTGAEAIRRATEYAMERDPRVILMGEGATDPKGIFGTTLGLEAKFSSQRVMEMPLSENGWTGIAVGAAMMGQRPIIVHQRVEFALLSLEQLFNQAAKAHYVSAGAHRVPLVVRLVIGRGWGQGPMHSQSLESLFCSIPGLKVVMPSDPADAQTLLLAAIEDDNPVVFIEHRWIHHARARISESFEPAVLDGPKRIVEGQDVTVVATSYMTREAKSCAEVLSDYGCSVDLFDLRVLSPLRLDPIAASLKRTGRLVVVDTGHRSFGIGAEICSRLVEQHFSRFRSAPRRIGLPDHPTPSSRALVGQYYPNAPKIAEEIAKCCGLNEKATQASVARLQEMCGKHPIDVPNPTFKGPF